VVLLHGAGGDRASLLVEAQALARRGFGVLSFDGPGHGNSEGRITWSAQELAGVGAALDWLSGQKDVDAKRIGALGFSLGGYILSQASANDSRIKAVVLAATPSDPVAQVRWDHRRWWLLGELPALWALRRGGMNLDVRARDLVGKLAPRPLLVIGGTDDQTVPISMAHDLYAVAGEPKELYVIEGAGHSDLATVSAQAYTARIVGFFERNLL
jgi:dipeptidyl aminopeptidase/acylaminoacyl peptidase